MHQVGSGYNSKKTTEVDDTRLMCQCQFKSEQMAWYDGVLPSDPGKLSALKVEILLKTIDSSRRHRHLVHTIQSGA